MNRLARQCHCGAAIGVPCSPDGTCCPGRGNPLVSLFHAMARTTVEAAQLAERRTQAIDPGAAPSPVLEDPRERGEGN